MRYLENYHVPIRRLQSDENVK